MVTYTKYSFPYGPDSLTLETANEDSPTPSVRLALGKSLAVGRAEIVQRARSSMAGSHPTVSVTLRDTCTLAHANNDAALSARDVCAFIESAIQALMAPDFPFAFDIHLEVAAANSGQVRDFLATLAAAAAMRLAGAPLQGGLGAAKVSMNRSTLMLNPGSRQLASSEGSVLIAGSELGVLALEARGFDLEDRELLEAIVYGQRKLQVFIESLDHFVQRADVQELVWQHEKRDMYLEEQVEAIIGGEVCQLLEAAYDGQGRNCNSVDNERWVNLIAERLSPPYSIAQVRGAVERYAACVLRQWLLTGRVRTCLPEREVGDERLDFSGEDADSGHTAMHTEVVYIAAGANIAVLECTTPEERSVCDMMCEIDGNAHGVHRFSARVRTNGVSLTFLQMALGRASRARAAVLDHGQADESNWADLKKRGDKQNAYARTGA